MHQPATDSRQRTPLRGAAPPVKLAGALALIVAMTFLPRRWDLLYLAPAGLLGLLWLLSRMPVVFALRRLLLAQAFILGIALLSLLSPSARPAFLPVWLKSNLCVLTLLLLAWTTPFQELLQVLRRLRVPPVMLTTLALMQRYIPVLAGEARRMERARTSRTFSRRRRFLWRNLSTVIGQLFIRSADRAERIYLAMCARGWK